MFWSLANPRQKGELRGWRGEEERYARAKVTPDGSRDDRRTARALLSNFRLSNQDEICPG